MEKDLAFRKGQRCALSVLRCCWDGLVSGEKRDAGKWLDGGCGICNLPFTRISVSAGSEWTDWVEGLGRCVF